MNDIAEAPTSSPVGSAQYQEADWPLRYISLSGLTWKAGNSATGTPPVVMLHGWLDNSLTFVRLAPELARQTTVHAIDMAGHGHSGHRPAGQNYLLMDYVADLAELLDTHLLTGEDDQVDLVGHSLGGIVCALYAAAFPERVRRLVMIDSLGALSRPAEDTIPQLRRAINKRLAGSGRQTIYPNLETAAKAREGGLSPLSPEAALTLTPRNMKPEGEGLVWRTDPRLRHPTPMMMDEEQVIASLKAIATPTLFVRAQEGLLAARKGIDLRREVIQNLRVADVPGGHHCHLDGDTAPVTLAVKQFLTNE